MENLSKLQALEKYKILCERRIEELCPGHTFPIRFEDIGAVSKPRNPELHLAKRRIARLEQQLGNSKPAYPVLSAYPDPSLHIEANQLKGLYASSYTKIQSLLHDKEALEESLRAEILTSEEQRIFIEVLKQVRETKISELGLNCEINQSLHFSAKNNKENLDKIKLTMAASKVQQLEAELEKRIAGYKEMEKDQENANCHLQEAAEALKYAEEEVQRLEEEKSSLIDYIEENEVKSKNLLKAFEKDRITLETKCKTLENELASVRRTLYGNQEKYEKIQESTSLTVKQSEDLKQEINLYKNSNEDLQKNIATLTTTLKETQVELNTIQTAYDEAKKDLSIMKQSVNEISIENQTVLEEKKRIQRKLEQADSDTLRRNSQLEEEIRNAHKESLEKEKNYKKQLEKQKEFFEELQEEYKNIENYRNEMINRISDYELENNNLSDELLLHKKQEDLLKIENNRLSTQLLEEQSSKTQLSVQNIQAIKELQKNKHSASEFQEIIRKRENELNLMKNELLRTKQNLQTLSEFQGNSNVTAESAVTEETIKRCFQIISIFCNNFGIITITSSAYNTIVSTQIKNLLIKWNSAPPSLSNLEEWIQLTTDELEAFIRRLGDQKAQSKATNHELYTLTHHLDIIVKEKALIELEINSIRKDYLNSVEENTKLKDHIRLSGPTSDNFSINILEEKANLLLKEKKRIERTIYKIKNSVNPHIQHVILEILKIYGSLELAEREQIRFDSQLSGYHSELKIKNNTDIFSIGLQIEQLKETIFQNDDKINSLNNQLRRLEAELDSIQDAS